MADQKLSSLPAPSSSSPPHQNRSTGGAVPKRPSTPQQNGQLDQGPVHHDPSNTSHVTQPHPAPSSWMSVPTSLLRTLTGHMTPVPGSSPEGRSSSSRPRGQSLGSALSSRVTVTRSKRRSSQQEEPEALLDLILESQGQRLDDQRASISLLPDPGPVAQCGACGPAQSYLPSLDFYYMLIQYQSDRMEDQRCPLPDPDDAVGSVPEGQEDFFSLIQRVQSRRMDEQRSSLLVTHAEDEDGAHTAGSSPHNHRQ